MQPFDQNARFGKYRIIREIGRGGMGVVFKARDTRLERIVALKVLHPPFAMDAAFAKRFRAEARAVAALNHPGVVRIHSLEELDGLTIIDMEYLSRGSMLERLQWPAMSIDEAVIVSVEVLHALSTCHASGIVHRDIKPSNILFSEDDRAVLSDFGLAKSISSAWTSAASRSASGTVTVGTPLYMPPEAWDDAAPEPSWDLYAMGIVMYQAISRTAPLNATTARGVVKELSTGHAPQLCSKVPQVSPALNDLIYALSARNRRERIDDASEALERLCLTSEYQRAAAKHSTPHRTTVPVKRGTRRLRRTLGRALSAPVARVMALAMAVVIGGGGVALSTRMGQLGGGNSANISSAAIIGNAPPAHAPIRGEAEVAAERRGVFHTFYDTVIAETGETYSNHIAIRLRDQDEAGVLFAKTSKKIWYLHLAREPEQRFSMSGHWAHYEGDENHFRYGRVEGSAQFRAPNVLLAKLEFTDADTGESFTRTFTASRTPDSMTDTQFLLEAERVNELQPLLYNELLPRGLAWAEELEQVFPAMNGARLSAPIVPNSVPRPKIDGRLDDAMWDHPRGARVNRIGMVLGEPGAIVPELNARFTADAIYLSFSVYENLSREKTGIDIALARNVSIPTWQSERWMYCHRGAGTPYVVHRVAAEDVPWDPQWEIGTQSENGIWSAEVKIPYESIGLEEMPAPSDRLRLNAAIYDLSKGEPEQRFQWGYPITLRIEHGIILQVVEPVDL